jgi:hypothetical protein
VEELKEVSQKSRWIKVWYESGHTLTNGAIFEVRYRDQSFDKFCWGEFKDYEIKKEKFWQGETFPDNLCDLIGTRNSLFCWVRNKWPPCDGPYSETAGWLACDDGAMEIADFIHLDVGGKEPVLTQSHIKASESDSAKRSFSVPRFERVTSQAVKNLRFLDRLNMEGGLRQGLKTQIGKCVWHDGLVSNRDEMLEAIAQIGASYRRVVVILQPQIRKSKLDEVRKAISEGKSSKDTDRIRQLDTLLLGAQASCRSFNAELWVLADKA